jgi:hypothetical protein
MSQPQVIPTPQGPVWWVVRAFRIVVLTVGALLLLALLAGAAMEFLWANSPKKKERALATRVLNDARIYEAAIRQWEIEQRKPADASVRFSEVSDYIKGYEELRRASGHDVLGNAYEFTTIARRVKVNRASYDRLSKVVPPEFWREFAPAGTRGPP